MGEVEEREEDLRGEEETEVEEVREVSLIELTDDPADVEVEVAPVDEVVVAEEMVAEIETLVELTIALIDEVSLSVLDLIAPFSVINILRTWHSARPFHRLSCEPAQPSPRHQQ